MCWCVCVYGICNGMYVEVRGQLAVIIFFFYKVDFVTELKAGLAANAFTH